jgi:hypothetical protein
VLAAKKYLPEARFEGKIEGSVLDLLICYNVVIERSQYHGSSFFTLSLLWQ